MMYNLKLACWNGLNQPECAVKSWCSELVIFLCRVTTATDLTDRSDCSHENEVSFFFQEMGRLQQLATRLVWKNHVMSHTSSYSQLSASHLLWSVTRSDGGYEVRPRNHLSGLSLVCFSCAGDRWVLHHYWLHWLFGWIDSSVGLVEQVELLLVDTLEGADCSLLF